MDGERSSDRIYYHVITRDFQVFELYAELTATPPIWILGCVVD